MSDDKDRVVDLSIEELVRDGWRGCEQVYTAWALTRRGREEIEVYTDVDDAIDDMLDLWPESDEDDILIEGSDGRGRAYLARGSRDARVVHIYSLPEEGTAPIRVESWKCEYVTDPVTGRIVTKKTPLD